MKVENLTENQKLKVWIDYMVTQVCLNNTIYEFPITARGVSDEATMYPTLGVKTVKIDKPYRIKKFDEFCAEENNQDNRVSECLVGWFWRFKDRIFK